MYTAILMTKEIKSVLQHLFQKQHNWKTQLLQNWPSIIGTLSSKVQLEKIKDDTLVLGVTDSCWLQELYLMSPLLLNSITKKLDSPRIKHLRFKKVGIKKQTKHKVRKTKIKTKTRQLSSKEQQALKNIKDVELSRAMEQFLIRCQLEGE